MPDSLSWQAMRVPTSVVMHTSQRLRPIGKPCETGLLGARCHDRASSKAVSNSTGKGARFDVNTRGAGCVLDGARSVYPPSALARAPDPRGRSAAAGTY